MDSLSRLTQVTLLLRQRLSEKQIGSGNTAQTQRGDSSTGSTQGYAAGSPAQEADVAERVRALRTAGANDKQVRRAVIETILRGELSSQDLALDADFQQLVDLVCETIDIDEDLQSLLAAVAR